MTGSTRTIWIIAAVAVVSLIAGIGLSKLIISPAQAAANAEPPEAGPITVPVESRALANDVTIRGDAIYEDPVQVTVETGDIGGPAIVTGQVPEVGATLEAGAVMLEITGRPVILLPGELPVYRTLRAGVSGPDVLQLKQALLSLGIDPGGAESDAYDAAAAAGVAELYNRIGYPAPSASEDAGATVDSARAAVRSAEEQVASSQRELTAARAGVQHSERVRLQAEVNSAQARLDLARQACDAPVEGQLCDPGAVVEADGALAYAIAARDEGNVAPDVSSQQAALASAQRALAEAQQDLSAAQRDTLTPLPASEVVYLSTTPRRVDQVTVSRGSTVTGSVMSVSGATLQIAGSASDVDARLLTVGAEAIITLPGGVDVPGTIESIGAPPTTTSGDGGDGGSGGSSGSDSGRKRIIIVPGELTEEQRAELQGSNVRVRVPVSSTGGEVLAVPTAALSAGPGGEARVEVLDGDGVSTLVTVETGLAAGGFVEVTAVDGGKLGVGDRVVVGITRSSGDDEDEESGSSDTQTEETDEAETQDAAG
ncbi:hypothetical protein [Actinotalea sp. K2]|uniref:hypothetical protein n=1 Tax=Actinotalea sp. K2 TaxID=2939438 RepID=UPI0020178F1C|nr:hypothetical protein [Actinotalea sp. K2]MCL3859878.1 hypothetical protein [Actinotalea sp. K2]